MMLLQILMNLVFLCACAFFLYSTDKRKSVNNMNSCTRNTRLKLKQNKITHQGKRLKRKGKYNRPFRLQICQKHRFHFPLCFLHLSQTHFLCQLQSFSSLLLKNLHFSSDAEKYTIKIRKPNLLVINHFTTYGIYLNLYYKLLQLKP
jgi:hypothetical protein